MGLKGHTLFGYAPQFCQTIHLIPAAISKYGPFPVHKGMKPSQLRGTLTHDSSLSYFIYAKETNPLASSSSRAPESARM